MSPYDIAAFRRIAIATAVAACALWAAKSHALTGPFPQLPNTIAVGSVVTDEDVDAIGAHLDSKGPDAMFAIAVRKGDGIAALRGPVSALIADEGMARFVSFVRDNCSDDLPCLLQVLAPKGKEA